MKYPLTKKRTIAELSAALNASTKSDNPDSTRWRKFFPFYKVEAGETSVVRFLPDADDSNPLAFLVEHHSHKLNINGKETTVRCIRRESKSCPICDYARRSYDKDDELFENAEAKALYRKVSYIGQVVVLETPIQGIATDSTLLIEFGPQIYKQIEAAFQSGDLEEAPYEFTGGYNFRLRKTKTASGQNSYVTSNFAPRASNLPDSIVDKLELHNLADYQLPLLSKDELKSLLEQHLGV